jgi:hypothetical protein
MDVGPGRQGRVLRQSLSHIVVGPVDIVIFLGRVRGQLDRCCIGGAMSGVSRLRRNAHLSVRCRASSGHVVGPLYRLALSQSGTIIT